MEKRRNTYKDEKMKYGIRRKKKSMDGRKRRSTKRRNYMSEIWKIREERGNKVRKLKQGTGGRVIARYRKEEKVWYVKTEQNDKKIENRSERKSWRMENDELNSGRYM